MNGVIDDDASLGGMTDVYDAIIDAAVDWAIGNQLKAFDLSEPPAAIAVIAMGRYGGREVNFSSDADAMIIYRPSGEADEVTANRFAPQGGRRPARDPAGTGVVGTDDSSWIWTCARRARTGRWSAPTPPARNTTGRGPAPGSIRRCCAPATPRATAR